MLEGFADLEIVIDAEDGEQLLAHLRRTAVDVIVMDMRMPKYSGIDVTRRLREHFVTSCAMPRRPALKGSVRGASVGA